MKYSKIILIIILIGSALLLPSPIGDSSVAYAGFVADLISSVPRMIANIVSTVVLTLVGATLYLSGALFDLSISVSILEFRDLININALRIGWVFARDIVNIIFIFILLYIAIGTILKLFTAEEMLVKVIIIALLVNFSGVLTKIVIDASNVLAIEIYNRVSPPAGRTFGGNNIGVMLYTRLGLQSFTQDPQDPSALNEDPDNNPRSIGQIIASIAGSAFLVLTTSFVLLAGTFFFFLRSLVFILLYIISPFAFAAWAIPNMSGQFKKWWKILINQAIFAPVFMFFVAIVVIVINESSLNSLIGKVDDGIWLSGALKTLILFIVLNGLMIGGLIIAKKLGVAGGNAATRFGGMGFGLAGWLGRGTVGRGAQMIADSKTVKDLAAQKGFKGMLGRTLLKTTQKTSESSFDLRATKAGDLLKDYTGDTGKVTGKGGYKKSLEEYAKKEEKFTKSLGDENKDVYAKNLAKRRGLARLFLGVPKKHKVAAEKIGRFKEKAKIEKYNEQINIEIGEIKEQNNYTVKKDRLDKARNNLDTLKGALERTLASPDSSQDHINSLRNQTGSAQESYNNAKERVDEVDKKIKDKLKEKKRFREKDSLEEKMDKLLEREEKEKKTGGEEKKE